MKFTEAFKALNYTVQSPRQHWSADRPDGVCITLWRVELKAVDGLPRADTLEMAKDNAIWRDKPGNRKRIVHLKRALSEFDGRIDVVIVHGSPGEGFGDADPWRPEKRGGYWKVTSLDEKTGHFQAEVVRT